MPRPVTLLDPVPDVPDLSGVRWWDEFSPPWCQLVNERAVDGARTRDLARYEVVRRDEVVPVRVGGTTPLQNVGAVSTRVWEAKNPKSYLWNPLSWQRLPLQPKVWISSNNDHTWFGIDRTAQKYYEASAMGPIGLGYQWRADIIRTFDLRKDWRAQQGSISASRIPTWTLVPSIEELELGAGGVRRALPFVAAGYGGKGQWIDPSRGTDGYMVGHPLWNGTRLRFTMGSYLRLMAEAQNVQDEAFAWAGRHVGFIVVDKTSEDAGHAVRMGNSPRLKVSCVFTLADVEVLA
jgi:hypothetical protein